MYPQTYQQAGGFRVSRRGLLAKLRQEVDRRSGGGMEGYYRYLRAQDAFCFRRDRREAMRLQEAGEEIQGAGLPTLRPLRRTPSHGRIARWRSDA
jgi:hypothetical protein